MTLAVAAMLALLVPPPVHALNVPAGDFSLSKRVKSFKQMRSENVVPQSLDYSCGPAALATLLSHYFNDFVSEQEIIDYLLLTGDVKKIKENKGFSLLDLKNFCRYRGYRVAGYQGDLEFFAMLDKPVLVPVNIKDYAHFVILRGVKGNRVFLADPALGKLSMHRKKFERIWAQGVGLVVSREGEDALDSPLKVSGDEQAVMPDPSVVKGNIAAEQIGKVLGDGQFK